MVYVRIVCSSVWSVYIYIYKCICNIVSIPANNYLNLFVVD